MNWLAIHNNAGGSADFLCVAHKAARVGVCKLLILSESWRRWGLGTEPRPVLEPLVLSDCIQLPQNHKNPILRQPFYPRLILGHCAPIIYSPLHTNLSWKTWAKTASQNSPSKSTQATTHLIIPCGIVLRIFTQKKNGTLLCCKPSDLFLWNFFSRFGPRLRVGSDCQRASTLRLNKWFPIDSHYSRLAVLHNWQISSALYLSLLDCHGLGHIKNTFYTHPSCDWGHQGIRQVSRLPTQAVHLDGRG